MADGKRAVDSDKVWTCLITNNDYLPGLLTLHYSLLKVKSQYPFVALYTSTFPESGLAALRARSIPHQKIEYLIPTKGKDYSNDPRFYDCWSKLTPFSLTQYSRIVQLDADMLVLQNMDELMGLELDDPEVAARATPIPVPVDADLDDTKAAPKTNALPTDPPSTRVFAAGHACVCNPLRKAHYPANWIPPNCAFSTQHPTPDLAQTVGPDPYSDLLQTPLGFMNGGLQVVNPSAALFAQIVQHMETGAANMDFADQSLLSELYWGRWVSLPYVYNALKSLRWEGIHHQIWKDEMVKNVHLILTPKPWEELDQDGNVPEDTDVTHVWWADMNKERKKIEMENNIPSDGF